MIIINRKIQSKTIKYYSHSVNTGYIICKTTKWEQHKSISITLRLVYFTGLKSYVETLSVTQKITCKLV